MVVASAGRNLDSLSVKRHSVDALFRQDGRSREKLLGGLTFLDAMPWPLVLAKLAAVWF